MTQIRFLEKNWYNFPLKKLELCTGMVKKVDPRLRDTTPGLPLATGASSRSLRTPLFSIHKNVLLEWVG